MCGISGFFSNKLLPGAREKLQNATIAQKHRGPDAIGFFFSKDGRVGLGHNRLSIIDLSERSNQPFFSEDGRYVIIYNGEVYNFKEIKEKLQLDTRTTSDTEVILQAFIQQGPGFVNQLKGMFSFAIFDQLKSKLFLFRDRLGIKPLHFYQDKGIIFFSSELKAIYRLLGGNLTSLLNKDAISNFLYLGYIPSHQSILRGVKKFPAGHYAEISENGFKLTPYWNPHEQIRPTTISRENEARKLVKDKIGVAVQRRLVSDVPIGTFLSGGTDSSLVTAFAAKALGHPIPTFAIGFREEKFNEAHFASKVAAHLGTEHYEMMLSYEDAKSMVEEMIDTYDEPFADSSAIPTMLVSKFAGKHVKVALSGDGGDELFLGYGMYRWAQRLSNPLLQSVRKPLAFLMDSSGNNRMKRAATVLNFPNIRTIKSHIFSQEQYLFSAGELEILLNDHITPKIEEELPAFARELLPGEEQAMFDLNHYLKDDLLVKVDRASMKYGLEVRVPFLDHELVETALNIDASLKIKGGIPKYLLKDILTDFLPKELVYRPKWGFSIPLIQWLRHDLRYLVDQYLSREVVEQFALLKYEYVAELKEKYFNGRDYLYNRIWVLLVLHMWLKKNLNE